VADCRRTAREGLEVLQLCLDESIDAPLLLLDLLLESIDVARVAGWVGRAVARERAA